MDVKKMRAYMAERSDEKTNRKLRDRKQDMENYSLEKRKKIHGKKKDSNMKTEKKK